MEFTTDPRFWGSRTVCLFLTQEGNKNRKQVRKPGVHKDLSNFLRKPLGYNKPGVTPRRQHKGMWKCRPEGQRTPEGVCEKHNRHVVCKCRIHGLSHSAEMELNCIELHWVTQQVWAEWHREEEVVWFLEKLGPKRYRSVLYSCGLASCVCCCSLNKSCLSWSVNDALCWIICWLPGLFSGLSGTKLLLNLTLRFNTQWELDSVRWLWFMLSSMRGKKMKTTSLGKHTRG